MKTVAEIAADIGVSRQAVYKKIKQEPLSTNLQPFTDNRDNRVYITPQGEELIKSAFSGIMGNNQSTVSTETVDNNDNLSTQFIASLQEQVRSLTEQNQDLREQLNIERQHSREQSDRITELAADMAKLANNAQHLHAGDIMPRLTSGGDTDQQTAQEMTASDPDQTERRGIFGLFKKNRK